MRSTEEAETRELTREEFESEIKKAVHEKLNSPQNSNYHEFKDLIRSRCKKLAKMIGNDTASEEMEKGLYMYFFQFLFHNPEGVKNIWKSFYDFNQEINQKDSEDTIELESGITCLLDPQIDGVTINWHIVQAMLMGDLEVIKSDFLGEEAYYFAIPSSENKESRVNNPARKKLKDQLEKQLGNAIIVKPEPNITIPTKEFGGKERKLFIGIYTFLKKDVDLLFYSTQWRNQIEKFFADIHKFLEGIVLDLEKISMSDKRKSKYRDFLREVIDTYLIPLREYSRQLVAYCSNNQLPADMLLEPLLIKDGLLQDGYKEADIKSVVAKWKNRKREIKEYVEGNMTILGIPVINTPATPIRSEEEARNNQTSSKALDEADKLSSLVRDGVRGTIGVEDTQPMGIHPPLNLEELGKTAAIKAIIDDERIRQAGRISLASTILDMPIYKDPPRKSFTELIRSKDAIGMYKILNECDAHEKSDYEEVLKEQIAGKFRKLSSNGSPDLSDLNALNLLRADLEDIIDGFVITASLRRFYFNELIRFFHIKLITNTQSDEIAFDLFSEIARRLEENLDLSINLSGFKTNNTKFPSLGDIASAKWLIQKAGGIESLWSYLKTKGRDKTAEAIEEQISSTLLGEYVISLGAIEEIHARCTNGLVPAEAFHAHIMSQKRSSERDKKKVKEVGKGFLSKLFLNGKTRSKLREYCKKNQQAIDEIFWKLLLPMSISYGKIMFGGEDPKLS